jgi:hypothetical protein
VGNGHEEQTPGKGAVDVSAAGSRAAVRDDFNAMGFLKLQGYVKPIAHWGFNPKRTIKEAAEALTVATSKTWKSGDVNTLLTRDSVIIL